MSIPATSGARSTGRRLFKETGIDMVMTYLRLGPGDTNLIMRHLVRKGYMRARRTGWRSWVDTETPAGFLPRGELASTHVHRLLGQLQWTKQLRTKKTTPNGLHAESRVVVLDTGEAAQLVYPSLQDLGVDYRDILGTHEACRLDRHDRVVLVSLGKTATEQCELREIGVPQERIVRMFGSPGKQRQERQPEPADAWRHA